RTARTATTTATPARTRNRHAPLDGERMRISAEGDSASAGSPSCCADNGVGSERCLQRLRCSLHLASASISPQHGYSRPGRRGQLLVGCQNRCHRRICRWFSLLTVYEAFQETGRPPRPLLRWPPRLLLEFRSEIRGSLMPALTRWFQRALSLDSRRARAATLPASRVARMARFGVRSGSLKRSLEEVIRLKETV